MNDSPQLHIIFPLFLTGLTITGISSIIITSLRLSYDPTDARLITAVITASIITSLLIILVIISWIEITQLHKTVPAIAHGPLSSTKLNHNITNFYNMSEAWEVILFTVGAFFTIIGMGTIFLETTPFFFIGLLMMGIAYYSYDKTMKTRAQLRAIIPSYSQIHLKQLAKLINKDSDHVQKALTHIIAFEKFPAKVDPETRIIFYNSDQSISQLDITSKDNQISHLQDENSIEVKKPIICAYCGEEAIFPDAKFCISCGASITAAK
jgi:hypothetical protein